ncbi:MAG: hypothetical protein R3Y51_04860 [Rikenellaceae bacterium]
MKNLTITLMFLFWLSTVHGENHDVTARQITAFYKQYITLILSSDYKDAKALLSTNLTEEAMQKAHRGAISSNANQIVRAQDVNETMVETVKVTHLEDDWYLVSFYWIVGDESAKIQIPLKAKSVENKLQISYIPHSANDGKYGDKQLGLPLRTKISDISQQSEQGFLESFYDVYLSNYCIMSLDLYPNLKALREKYLSENAQLDFKKAENDWLIDNMEGFDLLIGDFEFDAMWYNSLKIESVDKSNYKVVFNTGYYEVVICITVIKTDNSYKIDSITFPK